MQLVEFAEKHYFPHAKKTVRETTYIGYWSSYVKYVRPEFINMDMDDITVLQIEEWIDSIEKPGAAAKAFKVLRQILRRAQYCGMLHIDDPTEKQIRLPRTPGNQNKILSAEEVKQLLAGFRGHVLEPCVICSVMLGYVDVSHLGYYGKTLTLILVAYLFIVVYSILMDTKFAIQQRQNYLLGMYTCRLMRCKDCQKYAKILVHY